MSSSDKYAQGVLYPTLADVPNIETAMSTLVNGIVPLVVMRFNDANARAAALSGSAKPVPGMMTYLIAEDRWEAQRADGSWLLMSDGPWSPLTYASGYAANSGSPGYRKKAGGGVELRGVVKPSSGQLNDGGDIVKFASIPSALAPGAIRQFIVATNRATVSGVTRMTARVQIQTNGDLMYFAETDAGQGTTSAPGWFSLDGIQFSPDGD
jgi:hypothetical protein